MTERWLPVVGYEGLYEVSDFGRVKRVGKAKGATPGKILKPRDNGKGYLHLPLYSGGKKFRYYYLHRVIAAAFIGPCPPGMEVNHKDGVKANNAASNLEYVTHLENLCLASSAGLLKGNRQPRIKRLPVSPPPEGHPSSCRGANSIS